MPGIKEAAALVIGRQRMRRVRNSQAILVDEARLFAIRAREPAEEVIEGAVLHHHDHHMFKLRSAGRWERSSLCWCYRDARDCAGEG